MQHNLPIEFAILPIAVGIYSGVWQEVFYSGDQSPILASTIDNLWLLITHMITSGRRSQIWHNSLDPGQ